MRRKITIAVLIILSAFILASCNKESNNIESGTAGNDSIETTEKKQTTTEGNITEDEVVNLLQMPFAVHYHREITQKEEGSASVFLSDAYTYVTCFGYRGGEMDNIISDDPVANLKQYLAYMTVVAGPQIAVPFESDVKDIEGEYTQINGLDVYKFTAKVGVEYQPDTECLVYGYTWTHVNPDDMDENGIRHKYESCGYNFQYIIMGVVIVEDENYKADMIELTDYIMYNMEQLDK